MGVWMLVTFMNCTKQSHSLRQADNEGVSGLGNDMSIGRIDVSCGGVLVSSQALRETDHLVDVNLRTTLLLKTIIRYAYGDVGRATVLRHPGRQMFATILYDLLL